MFRLRAALLASALALGAVASANELLVNSHFEAFPYWGDGQLGGGYQVVVTNPQCGIYTQAISGVPGWKCYPLIADWGGADQGLTTPGYAPPFSTSPTMAIVNSWENYFAQTAPDPIVPGRKYTLSADFAYSLPIDWYVKAGRLQLWVGEFNPQNPNQMLPGAQLVGNILVGSQGFRDQVNPETWVVPPDMLNRLRLEWTAPDWASGKRLTVRFCTVGGTNGPTYWDNVSLTSDRQAVVIRVKPDGNDANDGLTWATAKQTISAAAQAVQPGDEIWIAKGVYREFVALTGRRYALYGGFKGDETDKQQRNRYENVTVIEQPDDPVYAAAVYVWGYFENTSAVLDGLDFKGWSSAVLVDWADEVTFSQCRFFSRDPQTPLTSNLVRIWDTRTTNMFGCSALYFKGRPDVSLIAVNNSGNWQAARRNGAFNMGGCHFEGITDTYALFWITNTEKVLIGGSVIWNSRGADGLTPVMFEGCGESILRCSSIGMHSGYYYTVIALGGSEAACHDCLLKFNEPFYSEIATFGGCSFRAVNNTVVFSKGRGFVSGQYSTFEAYNNILSNLLAWGVESWGGQFFSDYNIIHACGWGPYDNWSGNIRVGGHDILHDPMFMNPAEGDFRLSPLSAGQDAGDPSVVMYLVDVLGNWRIDANGCVDIGACEDSIVRDVVPPVTTHALSAEPTPEGWLNADVQVTLSATDANGVSATYYEIPGFVGPTLYTGPFTTPAGYEGELTIRYWSLDRFGGPAADGSYPFANRETPVEFVLRFDRTAPSTTHAVSGTQVDGWFTSSATIELTATDDRAGVRQTFYQVDANPAAIYAGAFKLSAAKGVHTVAYWSVDKAGNVEPVKTFTVAFDKDGPRISASLSPKSSKVGKGIVTSVMSGTITDEGSGVRSATFVDQNGQTQPLVLDASGAFSVSLAFNTAVPTTYRIVISAVDNLGFVSTKELTFTVK